MSHGGKGDKPRPLSVPLEKFDNQFENIFGKKPPKKQWVYVPSESPVDNNTDTDSKE